MVTVSIGSSGSKLSSGKRLLAIALLTSLCSFSVYAQRGMRHERGAHHGGMMGVSMIRHQFVRQHGIDAQYASKVSPLEPTAEVIESGRVVYQGNCAACHGPAGSGDGEAGAALSPAPADLRGLGQRPIASDAYLYWTIAEGGAPVGSAMLPFKDALQDDEIWSVIAYLRQL
jgi:mono/diheme cytochrome c family protein